MMNAIRPYYTLARHYLKKQKHRFAPQVEEGADATARQQLVQQISKRGFAVLPDYYAAEQCAALRQTVDRLLADKNKLNFVADSNDYRQYGADRLATEVRAFTEDPFLQRIGSEALQLELSAFFTLAAKISYLPGKLGSGGGWHRDTYLPYQFKAMLYLSDVTAENGPFQFVEGTHHWTSIFKQPLAGVAVQQQRYSPEEVTKVSKQNRAAQTHTFVAKAGTVVLFNSFALHRGSPLKAGTRYALTNYYFPKYEIRERERELNKKFNLPTGI